MAGMLSVITSFTVGLLQVCSLSAQSTWTQISPPPPIPTARYVASTIYNPTSNRLIVFGGSDQGGFYKNDVWVMTNANGSGPSIWTQLLVNGGSPGARSQHTAVYDAATNRMIVFGGFAPNLTEYNDVWVLANADGTGGTPTWSQLTPSGTTPRRTNHGAAYDAASNRMIVFLGDNTGYPFTETAQDAWVLTNANGVGGTPAWIQLAPSGTPPPGRWVNPIDTAYDPASNRVILYGGAHGKPNDRFTYGDTWVLTNANGLTGTPAWQQLNPTGSIPIARLGASGFYDSATNRMVIYGGTFDPGDFPSLSDTWVLSNANGVGTPFWQQVLPQGNQIQARRFDQGVYDKLRNLMIIYGGQLTAGSSLPTTSETWVLSNANGLGVNQQLRIDAVTPNHGGNAGTATVRLTGAGFQSGAVVKLTGIGPDIVGTNTQFIDSGLVTTIFNITGRSPGLRTLVVTNPNNVSISLPSIFTVEQGGTAQVWVDILGRSNIRIGQQQTYYLECGNRGNVDAVVIQCWVSFPNSISWSAVPPDNASLSNTISSSGNVVVGVELLGVAPGSTGFVPIILGTTTSNPFTLTVWSNQQ